MSESVRNSWSSRTKIALGVTVLLVVGFCLGLWLTSFSNPEAPKWVSDQLKFKVYMPNKLPDRYKIDPNSFKIDEDTLIFKATDGLHSITFTEQQRPPDFDFDTFYAEQVEEIRTIDEAAFPAVYGKSILNGSKMISVVTDDVWVLATTTAPLDYSDMAPIAESL